MQATSLNFRANAQRAMTDENLVGALGKMKEGFRTRRAAAREALPEFDDLRDQAKALKDHVLENLDWYLERFEAQVLAKGGHVHWCKDAEEARQTVLKICRDAEAKTVTKGKSMISEEIGLNSFLEGQGIAPVETDLGEYIIQLRHEPPSHIIAPAIHVRQHQVSEIFRKTHTDFDPDRPLEEVRELLDEAREVMRTSFLAADVGITGANMLIAETGSTVIVTNEGNGDLTQILPKVHVVLASLEKIVPSLDDAALILRLLARSATGQDMSAYTTFSTGPRRAEDPDGPEAYHVILLDNGRTDMLGSEFQDMLRCIRCGACMNHCPVYGSVGGHAYGWVYPGPMGAVLTPSLIGIENAAPLPNASSLCGRCEAVCPMRIPLPKMLRAWRDREFEQGLTPKTARWGLALWSFFASRPGLYRLSTRWGARILRLMGAKKGHIRSVGLPNGWTMVRDIPVPQGRTFMDQIAARQKGA